MKNKLTICFYLLLCSFAFTQELVVNLDPQADIAPNIAPQTQNRTGHIWYNSTETTNFQLEASDQDGDDLTFTIVTPPTNGTVTITETQTVGIVSQYVASYTPNTGFPDSNNWDVVDTFSFKVNDGQEDSNISTVNIRAYPKHEKHNWTYSFSGTIRSTIYDDQGNTYQVGYFNPLTNFIDGTSLDANYTPNISYTDAYIIKLNDGGELQWSKIVSGEKHQYLENILFSVDGNIIARGSTDDTAIFNDGSQLGSDGNNDQDFIIKFDANSGDVLWKVLDESEAISEYFNLHSVLSNGDILFFSRYSGSDNNQIKKLNSSNGEVTDVSTNGFISNNYIRVIETDNDDNIYIGSYGNGNYPEYLNSYLIKYDSNLNLLWNVTVSDDGSGDWYSEINDINYDPINDLLYVAGRARDANLNPLGDSVILSNGSNEGGYFAAYNTSGILQLSHGFETDINSYGSLNYNSLDIFDNKLVIRGYFNGSIDFDVTDGVFYTPLTGNNNNAYLSIYDLTNGLNFTGHYYDDGSLFYQRDIFYKNEKIKVGRTQYDTYGFYDYDGSYWINSAYTNPQTSNSDYGSSAGVMEFLIDDENVNFPPIAEDQEVTTIQNSSIEITLVATDEDNDPLTYIIVEEPTNGTITISDNLVNYSPNNGYFGEDSFRFKANDGVQNSNTATVTINVGCILTRIFKFYLNPCSRHYHEPSQLKEHKCRFQ